MAFSETTIIQLTSGIVYSLLSWSDPNYWHLWSGIAFSLGLINIAPWRLPAENYPLEVISHLFRRITVYLSFFLLMAGLFTYFFYDMAYEDQLSSHRVAFAYWLLRCLSRRGWEIPAALCGGLILRLYYYRFIHPWISSISRDWRNLQVRERASDIRNDRLIFKPKEFIPCQQYKNGHVLIGLKDDGSPVYIAKSRWHINNMQICDPSDAGTSKLFGYLADQGIRSGDQVIYIDTKADHCAADIIFKAAKDGQRQFIYLSFCDNGVGYWSPFLGGSRRDAISRMKSVFSMSEFGNDADCYNIFEKVPLGSIQESSESLELETLLRIIRSSNLRKPDNREKALKVEALLDSWLHLRNLNPPMLSSGISIEKTLIEGANLYIQGDMHDAAVNMAIKAFIMEVVQESRRLRNKRKFHLTLVIGDIGLIFSKSLCSALSTIKSFRMNFIICNQSLSDLVAMEASSPDGSSIANCINNNTRFKFFYGGVDYAHAKRVSELSGTVSKEVTGIEKTRVRPAGTEAWEGGRTIRPLEEPLIPVNVMLALPHHVGIFFQPGHLATPVFTHAVATNNSRHFERWLQAEYEKEHLGRSARLSAPLPVSPDD